MERVSYSLKGHFVTFQAARTRPPALSGPRGADLDADSHRLPAQAHSSRTGTPGARGRSQCQSPEARGLSLRNFPTWKSGPGVPASLPALECGQRKATGRTQPSAERKRGGGMQDHSSRRDARNDDEPVLRTRGPLYDLFCPKFLPPYSPSAPCALQLLGHLPRGPLRSARGLPGGGGEWWLGLLPACWRRPEVAVPGLLESC